MTQAQCGLCLSCGAPFLPSSKEVSFYNRKGNLSVLYLNAEFENDPELRRLFDKPKFSEPRDMAHIFHVSHHSTAIDYMCNHHTGDESPTMPAAGHALPRRNGPLPYFISPTSNVGPHCAVWARPPEDERLDFSTMLDHIVDSASHVSRHNRDTRRPLSIDMTYPMCKGCNAIMTSTANMRYIVGFCATARSNQNGCIIPNDTTPISAAVASKGGGRELKFAYGNWTCPNPAVVSLHPAYDATDAVAPHVAYFLHTCLPFVSDAHPDPFDNAAMPGSVRTARTLYIELSWLILEIACIATLIEFGHRYDGGGRSHGMQQHWGALDIYVSFFLWRLFEFDHKEAVLRTGLDFQQWHQKYFWDVIHCTALFPAPLPNATVGVTVYNSTDINSRDLLELICERLMDIYLVKLPPLFNFLRGFNPAPPLTDEQLFVNKYFLPLRAMVQLRNTAIAQARPLPFPTPRPSPPMTARFTDKGQGL